MKRAYSVAGIPSLVCCVLLQWVSGLSGQQFREYIRLGDRVIAIEPGYTLTARPTTVNSGNTITVSWTAPPGSSVNDWIGLYPVGAPNNSSYPSIQWQYTQGAVAGNLPFAAPVSSGQYEFRYLLNNSYTMPVKTSPIAVTAVYTLTVTPSPVTAGTTFTVNWTAPSNSSATDWIGLYPVGAPTNGSSPSIQWIYTNGAASGSVPFTAPFPVGQYELRYCLNNSYTLALTPAPITTNGYVVTAPSPASPNTTFTATWNAPAGHSALDWIGLYAVGAPHGNASPAISWQYTGSATSGAMTFSAPSTAGQYELRYFLNDGYVLATKTGAISVN